jgi:superfamily II helicase
MRGVIKKTEEGWVVVYCGYDFTGMPVVGSVPLSMRDVDKGDILIYDGCEVEVNIEKEQYIHDYEYPNDSNFQVVYKERDVAVITQFIMSANYETIDQPSVTRVEVIDSKGRAYVNMKVKKLQLSYQDNNRTLKLFIE